jgi:two-component system LytT family response regulator
MIKAIVVDDEAPARREMKRLLDEHPSVAIVGEARDLRTARGLLLRTRPDVAFLDIRLGKESGFDLLDDVDPETAVVFVTAFDEHAVQAFEASAVDYLVKPVEPRRLAVSIERLEALEAARSAGRSGAARSGEPFTPLRWVFLDTGSESAFVEIATITHVVAEKGGSRIQTSERRSLPSGRSLAEWERRLPADDFLRVHRSAIINLRHVERVEPWSNYAYRVHLKGWDAPVTMSRRYAVDLRDRFG